MPTGPDDDQELMRRVTSGDDEAFSTLVIRHRQRAEAYAASILKDAQSAQDVVQDSFTKVYVLRHEYHMDFQFQTYLYALIRNRCIDELRKRRRHGELLSLTTAPPAAGNDSPEEAYLHRESRLRLMAAISELSATDQRLLLGFARDGRSYSQLARELNISMAQVKIRLYRIRKRLKRAREDF